MLSVDEWLDDSDAVGLHGPADVHDRGVESVEDCPDQDRNAGALNRRGKILVLFHCGQIGRFYDIWEIFNLCGVNKI
jgi:hypothetical protein